MFLVLVRLAALLVSVKLAPVPNSGVALWNEDVKLSQAANWETRDVSQGVAESQTLAVAKADVAKVVLTAKAMADSFVDKVILILPR